MEHKRPLQHSPSLSILALTVSHYSYTEKQRTVNRTIDLLTAEGVSPFMDGNETKEVDNIVHNTPEHGVAPTTTTCWTQVQFED
jgi:hypothetical protein